MGVHLTATAQCRHIIQLYEVSGREGERERRRGRKERRKEEKRDRREKRERRGERSSIPPLFTAWCKYVFGYMR
jgi:hypothetical protein